MGLCPIRLIGNVGVNLDGIQHERTPETDEAYS